MWEALHEVQQALFQYDIPRAARNLVAIIDTLTEYESRLEPVSREELREVLMTLNLALQNQDYLLVADLLEYRIKPLNGQMFQ